MNSALSPQQKLTLVEHLADARRLLKENEGLGPRVAKLVRGGVDETGNGYAADPDPERAFAELLRGVERIHSAVNRLADALAALVRS